MRRSRTLLFGTATAAAVLFVGLVVVLLQSRDEVPATAEASLAAESPERTVNASTEEVATRFLEAYGAFDLEQTMSYLAHDATIPSLGAKDDPRLLISWLKATGYQQSVDSCEQLGDSESGSARCPFDFHALRSAEIGRGPFHGSSFDLTVRDGKIVRVSQAWEIEKFSPQVWEPFARWVSKAQPEAPR